MKSMRFFFAMLLLCGWNLAAYSQAVGTLTGSIKTDSNSPIGFANVVLVHAADTAFIAGMVADADGNFSISSPSEGKYILRVSALGYAGWASAAFEVGGPVFSKTFGFIVLTEDTKLLKEVTVQALRPAIVQQADRLVVNVEGTALAAGNTAFDVLSKAPGVFVDQDGNIRLNGKGGVQLMLDGKPTYLSAKDLRAMLQSMPAGNIKDLEIMANPSAKYDAEGASGIISINLKQNNADGINGSVYAGLQYNALAGDAAGGNLSVRKGKLSSFAMLDLVRRPNLRENEIKRVIHDPAAAFRFNQAGREEGHRLTPSLRVGGDYELNDRHSVGAVANLVTAREENTFGTQSVLHFGAIPDNMLITTVNNLQSELSSATFNFHYLGKLNTSGTTVSADFDYVKLTNDTGMEFINNYRQPGKGLSARSETLGSENPVSYNIYAAIADFVKPLHEAHKLELGTKISQVISDNDLRFFEGMGDDRMKDDNRSNHFVYKEDILAAYVNLSSKITNKWRMQGGLRAEQTFSSGNSLTLIERTSRNYLDFFPSLFLQQHVGEAYQISYQYSRRIDRPRYDDLYPFIFFLDPYTLAKGNPNLKPQYTDAFQMLHTLKSSYSVSLGYSNTKNYIAEIPEQNASDSTTLFQKRNVQSFKSVSATFVVPVRILPAWEMSNVLQVSYQHFSIEIKENLVENKQLYYLLQSNHNIQLPARVKLELNAAYQGPMAYGVYRVKPLGWLDIGFKRDFMNEKLEASLNLTDAFRSRHLRGEFSDSGNFNSFNQYRGSQSVRVQLRYSFNRGNKFDLNKRNTDLDELNRADK
ncbi:TonB-dependent receptor domain-containing protein [Pontibacter toksunensis]|uniref:TonB-dependent receptor domain-containing protein n=1 Tax=Pontibacter toksunensis TaxID=1332631 RepID=A0ABW6C0V7_9BACT